MRLIPQLDLSKRNGGPFWTSLIVSSDGSTAIFTLETTDASDVTIFCVKGKGSSVSASTRNLLLEERRD